MRRFWPIAVLLAGCGLLGGFYGVQVEASLPNGADGVEWALKEAKEGVVLEEGGMKAEGRARWTVSAYNADTVLEVFALSKDFPLAFGKVPLGANSAGRKVEVSPVRGQVRMTLDVPGFQSGDTLYVYVPKGLEEVELGGAPSLVGWAAVGKATSLAEPLSVLLSPKYRFYLKKGTQGCKSDELLLTSGEVRAAKEALRQGQPLPISRTLSFTCQ